MPSHQDIPEWLRAAAPSSALSFDLALGLKLRTQWPRLCDKVDCQHTDLLAARSCFQQCPFGRMPLPALPNLSSITLLTDFVVGHTLPSRPAHAPSLVSASWPMRPLLCNFRTTSSASLA